MSLLVGLVAAGIGLGIGTLVGALGGYFGGWIDTPIYDRATLGPGSTFSGPAILEQADTTTVIEPGMAARVDPFGNVLVEMA